MPRAPDHDLETFLRQLPPPRLADVLLELARDFDPVAKRLQRLRLANDPKRLAASFRKSLTGWRRASRFLTYREAAGFSLELQTWLGQIEGELLPVDPAAALDLIQAFIESDARFFDRADDSDGAIGEAIGAGCRLWLQVAAACESPPDEWPARLDALASGDEYGARQSLYRHADELLDEPALRGLAEQHMERMKAAVADVTTDRRDLPTSVYEISGTLGLLAEALGDPDVHVDAVLAYSPRPNVRQMEGFVRAYLACGRPAEALEWLDEPWDSMADTSERLRAEALVLLGRHADAAAIRQRVFEGSLSVHDLGFWIAALPADLQPEARSRARELALAQDDPVRAALVLIAVGDVEAAEAVLLAGAGRIDGNDYPALLPLAKTLESERSGAAATAVYRALLSAILERGYAGAYGHAARYWYRLAAIAAEGVDLTPLSMHEDYVAGIRSQHARKLSFWAEVNAKRPAGLAVED